MSPSRLPVELVPRAEPLDPLAAVGLGPVARTLAARLLQRPASELRELRGVAGVAVLAVLGASDALPWVEGITYFGRDARAPQLLLPTTLAPTVPVELFARALLAHHKDLAAPLLLLGPQRRVLSVAAALPIEPARLTQWLEAQR